MGIVRYLAPDTDAYVASVQRHAHEFEARDGASARDPHPRRATSTSRTASGRSSAGTIRPMSSCRGRCCCGSTSAPASSNRSTSTSPSGSTSRISCRACSRSTAGPAARATRSAPDRSWSSPSTASPTTSPSCRASWREHGLDVPQTWEDYFAVAARRRARTGGGPGFGQRGRGEWHTMYTGFATQLRSCGGRDFDPDGRAAFADADAVAVTAAFIEALRDAGPVDWTDQRWYELALDFGRGRYAPARRLRPLRRLLRGRALLRPGRADRLRAAAGGSAGERRPNLWTWSLAMTAASRDKRAARTSSPGRRRSRSCCAPPARAT